MVFIVFSMLPILGAVSGAAGGPPRNYAMDHPRNDLLRLKGLIAWAQWPPEAWEGLEQLSSLVSTLFRTCAPLQAWLAEHVGIPA